MWVVLSTRFMWLCLNKWFNLNKRLCLKGMKLRESNELFWANELTQRRTRVRADWSTWRRIWAGLKLKVTAGLITLTWPAPETRRRTNCCVKYLLQTAGSVCPGSPGGGQTKATCPTSPGYQSNLIPHRQIKTVLIYPTFRLLMLDVPNSNLFSVTAVSPRFILISNNFITQIWITLLKCFILNHT